MKRQNVYLEQSLNIMNLKNQQILQYLRQYKFSKTETVNDVDEETITKQNIISFYKDNTNSLRNHNVDNKDDKLNHEIWQQGKLKTEKWAIRI